jgi:hypothetical protein
MQFNLVSISMFSCVAMALVTNQNGMANQPQSNPSNRHPRSNNKPKPKDDQPPAPGEDD